MVVIVGMIGFNRTHPTIAAAVMGAMLGALMFLGIIEIEHTALGGIILIIALAIAHGRNKK